MTPLEPGARVVVVDPSDEFCGEVGTVTVAQHPAVLTGRPMVEVRLDGREWMYDVGYYLSQVDELPTAVPA